MQIAFKRVYQKRLFPSYFRDSSQIVVQNIIYWPLELSAFKRPWGANPSKNSGLHLLEVQSMGDVVSREKSGNQVGDGAGFATVGTKLEGVQSSLPMERQIRILCTTSSKICSISFLLRC